MPDISALAAKSDLVTVEVILPNGETFIGEGPDGRPAPASITYHPPGSKKFVAAKARADGRNVKRVRARGAKVDETGEEDLAHIAAFLTDIVVSFNNFDYKPDQYPRDDQGQQNPEMFRACFKNPGMGWLTNWFNSEAGDWGNAGAGSSQS